MPDGRYQSFAEFYPFYLSEHSRRETRRIHFMGSALALLCLLWALLSGEARWFLAAVICGYGFAWFGHVFFEKNRPATFRYPLYSLMGDWKMFWQILTGKIAF
ncbi:MAG TPA: DUF962 domain-containing protein [Rhizomicrobium sp.]|nr:DUF962 domain-containing protein [Rhizomicrobium sp.]